MIEVAREEYICLKNKIEEEDYKRIKALEELCVSCGGVNLKLELEYKLSLKKKNPSPVKAINEFFYYAGDELIGYLGISNFGGSEVELNGMVHPMWRRQGIFNRLCSLAKDESKRRGYEKILLLCDDKSESGKKFISTSEAEYAFSEYKMKIEAEGKKITHEQKLAIRKASNNDAEEIGRMNCVFFGDPEIHISDIEEEERNNRITYLFVFEDKAIGKIRLEISENTAYIYGFGIIPDYRGRGFGREALLLTLDIIKNMSIVNVYLDVAAENNRALNLYKSCGFVEKSVMNYYKAK